MRRSFDNLLPYVSQALGRTTEELERACRLAVDADFPRVMELRRAVMASTWWNDEEYVRWRYFRRRTADGSIPFWICEHAGEILGACGLEPVTLAVDGQP